MKIPFNYYFMINAASNLSLEWILLAHLIIRSLTFIIAVLTQSIGFTSTIFIIILGNHYRNLNSFFYFYVFFHKSTSIIINRLKFDLLYYCNLNPMLIICYCLAFFTIIFNYLFYFQETMFRCLSFLHLTLYHFWVL